MANRLPLSPRVRRQIRDNTRRFKAKCAKYGKALDNLVRDVWFHGPMEQEKANPKAMLHPEFHDFFEWVTIDDQPFWDLSDQGKYHYYGYFRED